MTLNHNKKNTMVKFIKKRGNRGDSSMVSQGSTVLDETEL